ncbi:MAG: hypothetical protein V3571_14215 [Pseudodesulfovibrio sp.]
MITYILVGILAFLVGMLITLLVCRRGRRPKRMGENLNRFNFDKQKKYEKDGRKYPFSY